MKNKIKILLLFISITISVQAQQDPQFTHYMYNMSVINPAYTTGNFGVVNTGILHRSQWVGLTGAPKTSSLFLHSALTNKVEIGLSVLNDNLGDVVKQNNIFGDFAYKLDLEKNGQLSFGLKAGVTFYDVDFNGFALESGDISTDPNFTNSVHKSYLNMGAGVYYNTDNYYIGLSIPNMLPSKHLEENNGQYQGKENSHIFLTGGYVYELNDLFKIKPAFMAKYVKGAPVSLDLTANVLYDDKFEFGIGYRLEDAIRATPEFRIGYAYDHNVSNLGPFNSGSHEIIVLYDLDVLSLMKKGFDKSPRFF
jgi:type IX secretion system PorP/SprF family membrane protein